MHCINCGNKQNEGKFCAICGTTLSGELIERRQTRSRTVAKSDLRSSEYIEKVKIASKLFWNYFLSYLKQPSVVFKQGEKEFSNGIINILIMAFFVGLVLFTFMKNVPLSLLGSSYEPSFIPVIGSSLVFVFVSTAIVIGSLFLTIKFLAPGQSIKNIAGIYGTHLIPSTFLVLISFISLLLKAYDYSSFLLSIALLFGFFVIPVYILIKLLTEEVLLIDPLYCVIVYFVVFGIAFSIYLILLQGTVIGSALDRWVWTLVG